MSKDTDNYRRQSAESADALFQSMFSALKADDIAQIDVLVLTQPIADLMLEFVRTEGVAAGLPPEEPGMIAGYPYEVLESERACQLRLVELRSQGKTGCLLCR